jgi:transposase
MKGITTIGLDLAKNVLQIHGIDAEQKVVVARQLKRANVRAFFEKLPPCLVGMEACGSAHYWARELTRLGHTVRLMVARDVKAYVRRGSTDATDAAAICEAVGRVHVGTVTVKTEQQQCLLMLHKTRAQYIETRTRYVNIIRAHLSELGIVAPEGRAGFASLLVRLGDETDTSVPAGARIALLPCLEVLRTSERAVAAAEAAIRAAHKVDETSRRLERANGIGLMTASALSASAEVIRSYRAARHFAASLGLTPRICGTGGEVVLGPISKQGNGYLRRLLYLGAVARLSWAKRHPQRADPRLLRLLGEKKFKVAAIALANRQARVAWALVVRGGEYVANHQPVAPAARELGCR